MNASNFILAYKILKDISTKWVDYPAYTLGLIDEKGTKIKSPSTPEEKNVYDSYWKIVFNLKRILQRLVGKNTISQSIATAYLLKEEVDKTTIDIIVRELNLRDFEYADEDYKSTLLEAIIEDSNAPETETEKIIYDKLKAMNWKNIKKHDYGDAYYATSTLDGKVLIEYSKNDKHFNVFSKDGNKHIRTIKSNK